MTRSKIPLNYYTQRIVLYLLEKNSFKHISEVINFYNDSNAMRKRYKEALAELMKENFQRVKHTEQGYFLTENKINLMQKEARQIPKFAELENKMSEVTKNGDEKGIKLVADWVTHTPLSEAREIAEKIFYSEAFSGVIDAKIIGYIRFQLSIGKTRQEIIDQLTKLIDESIETKSEWMKNIKKWSDKPVF